MTVHPVFLSEKSELNPNDKPEKHEKAEKPTKTRLSGIWQVFIDFVFVHESLQNLDNLSN